MEIKEKLLLDTLLSKLIEDLKSERDKDWRRGINKLMKTPNYQLAGGYEADENYNKALGDLITLMK